MQSIEISNCEYESTYSALSDVPDDIEEVWSWLFNVVVWVQKLLVLRIIHLDSPCVSVGRLGLLGRIETTCLVHL